MANKGFILAFHSNNVAGHAFENNDHVALDQSLELMRQLGIPILRLLDVVRALRENAFGRLPERFVCLTLDDGPDYDWKPIDHPMHGRQEPIIDILRRRSKRVFGLWRRKCVATSFVIASPGARAEIAGEAGLDRLSDDWWAAAQASGFMDIGVHSWNHVHPSVSEMTRCPDLIERFEMVSSSEQAELQVRKAAEYVRNHARGDSAMIFAYPYGQVSPFLADQYFPSQHQLWAACSTDPQPVTGAADIWRLPRFVCGWHFKNRAELRRVLVD